MSDDLKDFIREVPDFPKPGIGFKDITPLLRDAGAFSRSVAAIAKLCQDAEIEADVLACPEARGFIFGAALAGHLNLGFIPIRKPGKLPYETSAIEYALEYGSDRVEMHIDAVENGQRVLLVDDLLATGGTTRACVDLIEKSGASVAACVFLVELTFLPGREVLEGYNVHSLIHY